MPTPKQYPVTFIFNGETLKKRTSDIAATLLKIKPAILLTDMFVIVKDGQNLVERKLPRNFARRVFQDDIARQIFISNLMLGK